MVNILTVSDVAGIIQRRGVVTSLMELIEQLRQDFARWSEYQKSARYGAHFPHGVMEVMPICGDDYFAFKYVNGHPENPKKHNKQNIVGVGLLADVETGYPVLISEMTLLTAMRTAATSALAADYLANASAKTIGIIGTGAQSEFQVLAHGVVRDIERVQYFDIDAQAMEKFAKNLVDYDLDVVACDNAESCIEGADIIITATAARRQTRVLQSDWLVAGQHITAIGGDCAGKTELDPDIIARSKVVIEFLAQSEQEGEIQNAERFQPDAELWELVCGSKTVRQSVEDITLFDSVGFAVEDYSALKWVHALAKMTDVGQETAILPEGSDTKNLFGLLGVKN